MRDRKEPLYRKVNTLARGVHHAAGKDFRHERTQKKHDDVRNESMHGTKQLGLDYTPLYKYLLSRVGESWPEVLAEAASRLDRTEPIFYLVALREQDRTPSVRIGEASYYSGLYVDDDDRLQLVDPTLTVEHLIPECPCCTHTLNGVRFTRKFSADASMV